MAEDFEGWVSCCDLIMSCTPSNASWLHYLIMPCMPSNASWLHYLIMPCMPSKASCGSDVPRSACIFMCVNTAASKASRAGNTAACIHLCFLAPFQLLTFSIALPTVHEFNISYSRHEQVRNGT